MKRTAEAGVFWRRILAISLSQHQLNDVRRECPSNRAERVDAYLSEDTFVKRCLKSEMALNHSGAPSEAKPKPELPVPNDLAVVLSKNRDGGQSVSIISSRCQWD